MEVFAEITRSVLGGVWVYRCFVNCDLDLESMSPGSMGSERRNFPAVSQHIPEIDNRKPLQTSGSYVMKVEVNV
jgi:hypothetical protein